MQRFVPERVLRTRISVAPQQLLSKTVQSVLRAPVQRRATLLVCLVDSHAVLHERVDRLAVVVLLLFGGVRGGDVGAVDALDERVLAVLVRQLREVSVRRDAKEVVHLLPASETRQVEEDLRRRHLCACAESEQLKYIRNVHVILTVRVFLRV